MKTERDMFVPMTVEDVKISLESNIEKLPYNTFQIETKTENCDNLEKLRRIRLMSDTRKVRQRQQEELAYLNQVREHDRKIAVGRGVLSED